MNKRFKEIRLKYKISQQEMSKILDIAQSHISKIENQGSSTTNETIEKFYKYFGIEETIYLISGEHIKFNENSEIEQLFNQLNDEYKAVAKYKIKELIKEQESENNKGKSSGYGQKDLRTS
ncbi:helix-turn-helix transcriptional regulator [Sedimentibacter sp.]|uniref:helix-turn-helix domain-containing protein n=1 Tax=Sedimentibacter sp. TaxID=1960295 RepID=UPI00289D10F0|nr:helix-turn-helix transcriptional regulator [Sedimentibacter sp.]